MKKLKIECMVSDDTYAKVKASIYLLRMYKKDPNAESVLMNVLAQIEEERLSPDINGDTHGDQKWQRFVEYIKKGYERQVIKEVRERLR